MRSLLAHEPGILDHSLLFSDFSLPAGERLAQAATQNISALGLLAPPLSQGIRRLNLSRPLRSQDILPRSPTRNGRMLQQTQVPSPLPPPVNRCQSLLPSFPFCAFQASNIPCCQFQDPTITFLLEFRTQFLLFNFVFFITMK